MWRRVVNPYRCALAAIIALIALAVAQTQTLIAQQPRWDEQLDGWVFNSDVATARTQLRARLTNLVEEVDRACNLSEAQKKKLLLTGQGDIVRFFECYERAKEKTRRLHQEASPFALLNQREVREVRVLFENGIFQVNSLLFKSLPNTLTAEQLSQYVAAKREARAAQHRENIERATEIFQIVLNLEDSQRESFRKLLETETRPGIKPSHNEYYRFLFLLSRLPEEKLKPLLDQKQWECLADLMRQARRMENQWRSGGVLPEEEPDVNVLLSTVTK